MSVLDTNGREHGGVLKELSDDRVVLKSDGSQAFSRNKLIRLTLSDRKGRSTAGTSLIVLANGDRFFATLSEIQDEQVRAILLAVPGQPPLAVPLETVRGVMLETDPKRPARELSRLLDTDLISDLVLSKNGDRIAGELVRVDGNSVTILAPSGEMNLRRDAVQAIAVNPRLTSFPPRSENESLLTLTDGSHLTVRQFRLSSEALIECKAAFGAEVRFPLSAIASIRFLGPHVAYLSDRVPVSYRHVPYASGSWQLERDCNVVGGPLRVRGRDYAKGLGMHTKSEVSYDLAGQYRRFGAVVGMDDDSGPYASAVFSVRLDGRDAWKSESLTMRSPPQTVGPIDLTDVRTLTLAVDFGEFGDVQDRADWCDAVLVKDE